MAVKSIYTKELGHEVALMAKGTPGQYHVMPNLKRKWIVVRSGKLRAIRVFYAQSEAFAFAKELASAEKGSVIIHNGEGKLNQRISF